MPIRIKTKKEYCPLDETGESAFSQSSSLVREIVIPPQERFSIAMEKGIYKADNPQILKNRVSAKTYRLEQLKAG